MNLTKLTKEQIEQKYETRSGHDIKITRIETTDIYCIKGIVLYPDESVVKSWTNNGTYYVDSSDKHHIDLVLKEDNITDEERLVFAMNELTVNDVVKYSNFVLQRGSAGDIGDCREFIDPLIMESRKPKITNTWYVNHYANGFTSVSYALLENANKHKLPDSHSKRTHILKTEVYSDGTIKTTKIGV